MEYSSYSFNLNLYLKLYAPGIIFFLIFIFSFWHVYMCAIPFKAIWQEQQKLWALTLAVFKLWRFCNSGFCAGGREKLTFEMLTVNLWNFWSRTVSKNLWTNGLSSRYLRLKLENSFLNRPLVWPVNCRLWRRNLVMKSLAWKPDRPELF